MRKILSLKANTVQVLVDRHQKKNLTSLATSKGVMTKCVSYHGLSTGKMRQNNTTQLLLSTDMLSLGRKTM